MHNAMSSVPSKGFGSDYFVSAYTESDSLMLSLYQKGSVLSTKSPDVGIVQGQMSPL